MHKIVLLKNNWLTSHYNLNIDKLSLGENIYGWFINLTAETYKVELIDEQGSAVDAINFGKVRPRLAEIYNYIPDAGYSGFEIDITKILSSKRYYLVVYGPEGYQRQVASIILNAPLLYVHIAKTAGSTVNKVISSWFPQESSLVHAESSANWFEQAYDENLKYLSGHIPYTKFIQSDIVQSFYSKAITFREPYSHVISHLAWIRALALDNNKAKYNAHPDYIQKLSDKLARYDLSNPLEITKLIESLNGSEFQLLDNTQTRYIRSEVNKASVEKSDLVSAIENLNNFEFIGTDNDISEFLVDIASSYGIEYKAENRRENVLSNKFGLDLNNKKIQEALYPLVAHDLDLYNIVNKKLTLKKAEPSAPEKVPLIVWGEEVEDTDFHPNFKAFIQSPESFLKRNNITLKLDLLNVSSRHNFPIKLLADAISNARIQFVSPFSGKVIYSATAVDINTYEFFDEGVIFYISTHISPKMQHSQAFLNIFIPEINRVVTYDYRKDKTDFLLNKEGTKGYLLKQFFKLIMPPNKSNTLDAIDATKSIVCNFGLAHMGHSLWQDISVFFTLLQNKKSCDKVELALINNFYSENISKTLSEVLPNLRFKNVSDMFSYAKGNNLFPVVLSDSYITESLANLIEENLESEVDKNYKALIDMSTSNKVLISLRSGTRCCINEKEFYSEIIKHISLNEPNILFIIDGMNDSFELDIHDSEQINALKESLEYEKEIVKFILEKNPSVKIVDLVGSRVSNSIYATRCSDVVISPWGAGLVKYKWICNKPNVFIYGSSATLSEKHAHKRLYDMELFRENAIDSTYFTGKSEFVDTSSTTREGNYKLDISDIVKEVTQFIKGSIYVK